MRETYDVIVVGAGPAGCSAAVFSAKMGCSVLLVDRARFPREKVCGDGISPPAVEVLAHMGVLEKVEQKAPFRIRGVTFSSPTGRTVTASFSEDRAGFGHGYVIPRKELDTLLLEHAGGLPGVDVRLGAKVTDLAFQGGLFCGIRVQSGNRSELYTGKIVIGADGARSTVARKASLASKNPHHTVFAVRGYFEHVEGLGHHIEIHCEKSVLPGYCWVFPIGARTANVGFGFLQSLSGRVDPRGRLDRIIEENALMRKRLESARLVDGSLRGWPIPLGTLGIRRGHRNLLLAGDAGRLADPLTGEGIYHALKSGELAAQAAHRGLSSGGRIGEVGRRYQRLCKRAFPAREYLVSYLIQRFVLRSFLLDLNINRSIKNPRMTRTLVDILTRRRSRLRLIL